MRFVRLCAVAGLFSQTLCRATSLWSWIHEEHFFVSIRHVGETCLMFEESSPAAQSIWMHLRGHQPACLQIKVSGIMNDEYGAHRADWEHVVVHIHNDEVKKVRYHQHSGSTPSTGAVLSLRTLTQLLMWVKTVMAAITMKEALEIAYTSRITGAFRTHSWRWMAGKTWSVPCQVLVVRWNLRCFQGCVSMCYIAPGSST